MDVDLDALQSMYQLYVQLYLDEFGEEFPADVIGKGYVIMIIDTCLKKGKRWEEYMQGE